MAVQAAQPLVKMAAMGDPDELSLHIHQLPHLLMTAEAVGVHLLVVR
jgi:hypothetical protein